MADILEDQVKKAKEREAELRALKGELTPEELASYEEEYKAVPVQREALKQGYDKSSDRKDWAELADIIAQNVAKIGAAKQGLDQNVDLSNLDIKGYDWDKARDRDLKRYSTELDPIGEREKSLAGLIALGAKKPKEDKIKLNEAMGVVTKGSQLPAYQIEGRPGYYDANYQPTDVEKYKRDLPERSPMINETIARDLLTKDGRPVYRTTIIDRNTLQAETRLADEQGKPLSKEEVDVKVGIDPKALVSDKQVGEITMQDNTLEALKKIKEVKKGVDTGKLENLRNWSAQWLGIDDPNVSTFKAEVNQQLGDYIRSVSGLTVNNQERTFLLNNTPNLGDKDETFNAKIDRLIPKLQEMKTRYLENLQRQGKNVTEFMAAGKPAGATQPAPQQEGAPSPVSSPASSPAASDKKVVKKQFSKTANKTKLIYSDGTEEIVDGQQ